MTTIKRTFPVFRVTKTGEAVSVKVDKRTIVIKSSALQGLSGPSAADIWRAQGNVGDDQAFLDSITNDCLIYTFAFSS